jgi:hypothetical protein
MGTTMRSRFDQVGFGWRIDAAGFHAASSGCLLSVKADIGGAGRIGGSKLPAAVRIRPASVGERRFLTLASSSGGRPLYLGT